MCSESIPGLKSSAAPSPPPIPHLHPQHVRDDGTRPQCDPRRCFPPRSGHGQCSHRPYRGLSNRTCPPIFRRRYAPNTGPSRHSTVPLLAARCWVGHFSAPATANRSRGLLTFNFCGSDATNAPPGRSEEHSSSFWHHGPGRRGRSETGAHPGSNPSEAPPLTASTR